ITAKQMGIKRVDQDELAAASHRNMAAAYDRGFFDDLVTPFLGLYRDNNLRPDSSADKLAKLKPVFGVKAGDATMTAGNSTPLTDGASVSLLSTDEWAAAHGIEPLAYYVDAETAAVDYVNGKDGLLMAPPYGVPRLLARSGLSLQDFDFYEIREAFASVVLAHLQAWESEEYCKERLGLDAALGRIDRDRLNVNGSSLAAGHPFAATGGRLVGAPGQPPPREKTRGGRIPICPGRGPGGTPVPGRALPSGARVPLPTTAAPRGACGARRHRDRAERGPVGNSRRLRTVRPARLRVAARTIRRATPAERDGTVTKPLVPDVLAARYASPELVTIWSAEEKVR